MDREAIISEITCIANKKGLTRLSEREFSSSTGIASHVIARYFDRWSDACSAAGIACETKNDNLVNKRGASRQECLDDILRVASELGTTTLTTEDYKKHGRFPGLRPVRRHFGDWPSALDAAGLNRPSSYHEPVSIDVLAVEFIDVAATLGRLPTTRELKRRTRTSVGSFIAKHGGYANYKIAIANWYVANEAKVNTPLFGEARSALLKLRSTGKAIPEEDPAPHRRGNILGFRQFAYAPTQEQDVVAIFNSVAEDLGFEIIANRVKFPDCLARERQTGARAHFHECKIEFEFRSSDYRAHGHPLKGCDLIVCWDDDWTPCPIRVLELSTRIRQLKGWR